MSDRLLHLLLPARAQNVIVVRQAVSGLAEALGLPRERIGDLRTVVTEACDNVVLHAYADGDGPLEVTATAAPGAIEVEVGDRGQGLRPSAGLEQEPTLGLGLGLPLIASLSDSYRIEGGAGAGTRMLMRFALGASPEPAGNGELPQRGVEELALQMRGGEAAKPVLARVIAALAARAHFSVERLADTVLIGDAVSAHDAGDFSSGRIEVAIEDGDGALAVRVGPLVEGGGRRILAEMELPEGGSLRGLASSMEVETEGSSQGDAVEYLVVKVLS